MVTQITVYAVYNPKMNARTVHITGQCLNGTRPVPNTMVTISSTWGESAYTETTLNYGSYSAVLSAPKDIEKARVIVSSQGHSVTSHIAHMGD
ncbi:MAG: hypothetical protein WAU96_14225 [Anaerolineae bacterium]|nr:hypothetical protein [Thermoflexales bacterium]HQW35137.1 hypothetical protein [Thermoflexales bacterium]